MGVGLMSGSRLWMGAMALLGCGTQFTSVLFACLMVTNWTRVESATMAPFLQVGIRSGSRPSAYQAATTTGSTHTSVLKSLTAAFHARRLQRAATLRLTTKLSTWSVRT